MAQASERLDDTNAAKDEVVPLPGPGASSTRNYSRFAPFLGLRGLSLPLLGG